MSCLLYAISLLVYGVAVDVQCRIARWGSEEPDWLGWPGVVVGSVLNVLVFNVLGFVALAVLRWRSTWSWLHAFLMGGYQVWLAELLLVGSCSSHSSYHWSSHLLSHPL